MRLLFGATAIVLVISACSPLSAATDRLLPPAEDFHLTLQHLPQSDIPLGPSCGGEASLTLPCQAFKLKLQNLSLHTIHISENRCAEPRVVFWKKMPSSSSGKWPISQPGQGACAARDWSDVRIRPGETAEYTTRLINPSRELDPISNDAVGVYSIHAEWVLYGCTEQVEGTNCLPPLEVVRPPGVAPPMDFQEPVMVVSNEVTVDLPPLPDLGKLKFSFQISIAEATTLDPLTTGNNSCKRSDTTIDCVTFHYSLRNLGDRAVRNGIFTCSDSDIGAEYRYEDGDWKQVPPHFWMCSANMYYEKPILPGEALDGTFTLPTLHPALDTTDLQAAGSYELRFTFFPKACFAAPDGSFCIQRPKDQPHILSNVVQVQVPKTPASN